MKPTYDLSKSYYWNYENGPIYKGVPPKLEARERKEFLGYRVNSTLGVAAGPLLNSRWISLYASLGFDILTYKTVRTLKFPCYEWPNLVCLDVKGQLEDPSPEERVVVRDTVPEDPTKVSLAVSFGMPSAEPAVWQADVEKAKATLSPGQILIVSVVGTPNGGGKLEALAEDFADCARMAVDAGADVVEANFSCPNVPGLEGQLFSRPHDASFVARRIREKMGDKPFLLKIGFLQDDAKIRELLLKTSPYIDGITLSNGLIKTITKRDGSPAFPGRERSGVVGACIRENAFETFLRFRSIADEMDLSLTWLTVGGVIGPEDVRRYYQNGADAVLVATGAMFRPHLALEVKETLPNL